MKSKSIITLSLLTGLLITSFSFAQQKTVQWQYIDTSTKPGDNFFQFANGNWLDTALIPSNRAGMGAAQESIDTLESALLSIIRSAASKQNAKGSREQWIGDFYKSGMDTLTIEKRGLSPLYPILKKIDAIRSPRDVVAFEGFINSYGDFYLFQPIIYSDLKNNKNEILHLYENGMGIPKDYYLKNGEALQPLKQAYIQKLSTMLDLSGDKKDNSNRAQAVFALEKQFADAYYPDEEARNFVEHYVKISIPDFDKKLQHFSLRNYVSILGAKTDTLALNNMAYFHKIDSLLAKVPLTVWKDYYKSRVISNYSSALSSAFREADIRYQQVYRGVKTQLPREKIVVNALSYMLGEAIGQLYVEKYFPASTKGKVLDMVQNFKVAFEDRLQENTWMDEVTRQKAIDKVHAFKAKIGYPDQWKSVQGIAIDSTKYLENILSCEKAKMQFELSRAGKPINNKLWIMLPQVYNAHVDMAQNGVVFTAAILQPPAFDPEAEDAVNYGGAGVIIGHEMSHNFDDMGVKFDKEGNLANWWSENDYSRFRKKSDELIKLYNGFRILDTLPVNGTLSVGENIGDLGGLAIAYSAFMLKQQKDPSPMINGFYARTKIFYCLCAIVAVEKDTGISKNDAQCR